LKIEYDGGDSSQNMKFYGSRTLSRFSQNMKFCDNPRPAFISRAFLRHINGAFV